MTSTETDTIQDQTPLFLLDIDGVLNLFDAWVPTGEHYWTSKGELRFKTKAPDHLNLKRAGGYELLLHPQHTAWIAEIEAEFDTVWATMWQDNAWMFGRVAGFGEDWDYVDFDSFRPKIGERRMVGNGVGTYKHPGIVAVLGDKPGVWVDDDMTPFQHEWARKRTEAGIPTLFIQPDPEFGMTREHVDQILAFAKDVAAVSIGV
jgi:hypothetical protein